MSLLTPYHRQLQPEYLLHFDHLQPYYRRDQWIHVALVVRVNRRSERGVFVYILAYFQAVRKVFTNMKGHTSNGLYPILEHSNNVINLGGILELAHALCNKSEAAENGEIAEHDI
jgi:hypothetical protein